MPISADFSPYTGPATSASSIFAEVMNSNPVHFPVLFPAPDTSNHPYFGNATGGFSQGFPNPYADMVKGYPKLYIHGRPAPMGVTGPSTCRGLSIMRRASARIMSVVWWCINRRITLSTYRVPISYLLYLIATRGSAAG